MPTKAVSRHGISNIACDRTERYREILRNLVKEAGAEADTAGKRILDLASRAKGLRHPNRKKRPRSRPN